MNLHAVVFDNLIDAKTGKTVSIEGVSKTQKEGMSMTAVRAKRAAQLFLARMSGDGKEY